MRFEPSALAIRCILLLAAFIVAVNLIALAVRYPGWLIVVTAGMAYRRLRRWQGASDSYGSARVSFIGDLWRRGLLSDHGLIVGTCGYMEKPTRRQGLRALFSPFLPSSMAVRLFFAAFLGHRWMER